MTTRVSAAVVVILLLPALIPARAEDAASGKSGDLWQVTQQMDMALPNGMTMPAQTSKVCRPKSDVIEPPKMGREDCKTDSVERNGKRVDWKMSCKDGTSGTGHVEYDRADHYTGGMALSMQQGEMKMKFEGTRVGECDTDDPASPQNRVKQVQAQAAAAQAQSANMMAQVCAEGAAKGNSMMFVGPMAQCKDPAQLKAFCASLGTPAGYDAAASAPAGSGYGLQESTGVCKIDADKLKQELCNAAASNASYDYLGGHCPAEAKALAQKECAGRKYTSIADEKLRGFCARYAQSLLGK